VTTSPGATTPSEPAAAARLVLESLGVSISDLLETEPSTTEVTPTFAEYVARVASAAQPGSRKTSSNYWRVLETEWGDRRIDEPKMSELIDLANKVQERANARRGSRGGVGAQSNFIDATRFLYKLAVGDRHIPADRNPAAELRRPDRRQSRRRALNSTQVAEINEVAGTPRSTPWSCASTPRQPADVAAFCGSGAAT